MQKAFTRKIEVFALRPIIVNYGKSSLTAGRRPRFWEKRTR